MELPAISVKSAMFPAQASLNRARIMSVHSPTNRIGHPHVYLRASDNLAPNQTRVNSISHARASAKGRCKAVGLTALSGVIIPLGLVGPFTGTSKRPAL